MDAQTEGEVKAIIDNLCKDVISKGKPSLIYNDKILEEIIDTYNELNPLVKIEMGYEEQEKRGNRIDRHKISAILTVAIVGNKPFFEKHTEGVSLSAYERNINYLIAIKTSLAAISFFNEEKVRPEIIKTKSFHGDLFKLLHSNRVNLKRMLGKGFDRENIELIFFLSHIYYYIEQLSLAGYNVGKINSKT